MSFVDLLSGSFTPDTIATIASRMGVDNAQAKKALWVALPALINGLKKNSETPEGADSLNAALEEHGDDSDDIVEVVTNGRAKKGDKIASHILWDSTNNLVQAMSTKAGIDSTKAQSLLEGLGPVVMEALWKAKKAEWFSANNISKILSGESWNIMKTVGGIFDQDGDGDFDISDALKIGVNFLQKK